eukprot:2324151-Rhodomonas_salina.1
MASSFFWSTPRPKRPPCPPSVPHFLRHLSTVSVEQHTLAQYRTSIAPYASSVPLSRSTIPELSSAPLTPLTPFAGSRA